MEKNFKQANEKLASARRLLMKGRIEQAEDLFLEIVEKFPDFLPARLEYADFLLETGASFEALGLLRKGFKNHEEDLGLRYLFAVARQKCWLLNLAEKEFEFLNKKKPKDPEILRQLGWTKVLRGEIKKGREFLRLAIDLDLMNPLPYLDLGASYVMYLDFKEALNWMETARHLDPESLVIVERIKATKQMEGEFKKFPEKDKETIRKMRQDPQQSKLMAVENMLLASRESPLAKEDLEDLKRESRLAGLNPKMMAFGAPETKEQKTVIEYMEYHYKVSDVERKISKKEFEQIRKKLLNQKTKQEELKKLLLILAHQGTEEAVKLLEEYFKKAPAKLKDWIKLCLEECKMFAKAKPGQMVKIIHQ